MLAIYLLELVRYIHRNPLRAGIVKKPGQYVWSSHCGYLSHDPDWEWLCKEFVLEMLGKTKSIQLKKYRQFVEWAKANFFKGRIQKDIPQSKILAPDRRAIINAVCGF